MLDHQHLETDPLKMKTTPKTHSGYQPVFVVSLILLGKKVNEDHSVFPLHSGAA